jgi:CRP-like cAMP-binding protein/chromosome segregation ATPase/rhodanese-related sulfurtransferase
MAVPNSKHDDLLLKNLVPLNTLSEEQLGHLLSQIVVEKAKKGDYLFREGDTDHQNIYLLSGTVALLSGQKEMDLISSGTPTSRFALAHQLPRKHSAQARTLVSFVRIDSRMLSDMLARSHSASYEVNDIEQPAGGDWMSLLLQSPVFQQIPPANLQRVMMRMEEIEVSAGDVIINQGDEGDYFYLISRGECTVSRAPEEGHAPIELARLKAGRGFGEEALISEKPRSSTVVMNADGVLVRLNKQDFIDLVKQPLSRTLSFDKAITYIDNGSLWLDVRTPEEYEAGHLPGAINMPFFSLRFQASSLTLDRAYVIYGEEVSQSATAAYLLTERGAEVFVVDSNWTEIEQLAGIGEDQSDSKICNVIDFNRESEDGSTAVAGSSETHQAELKRLTLELEEARSEFQQELEQRHTEVKLLRQALAVAKSQVTSGEEEAQAVEGLQQEVETLRQALAEAESKQIDETAAEESQKALQRQIDQLEERLNATKEELEGTRQFMEEATQQSDLLRQQIDRQQARHQENEGRFKEQITELQFELDNARESSQDECQKNEQLTAEIAALNEAMVLLKSEAESFHGQAEDGLASITLERDELAKVSQETEAQRQQLAEELSRLSQQHEELEQSRLELAQLQEEKIQQEELLTQQEGLLDEAEAELSRLTELLQAQQNDGAEEINRLQHQVADLEQEKERSQEREQQIKQSLEEARLGSDEELVLLRAQLHDQQDATRKLSEKQVELEAQLEQEHQTGEFLKRSLETAEQAVQVSAENLTEAEQRQQSLEAQLSAHEEAMQDALQQKSQAEQQLAEQQTTWQERLEALQSELDAEKESSQSANETLASLEAAREELEQQLTDAQTELHEHQQRYEDERNTQQQHEKSLVEELEQHKQQLVSLQSALDDANESLNQGVDQTELETAQQALCDAEQVIDSLNREITGLREVQMEMESHLTDDVDNELNSLRTALDAEQKKREKLEKEARQADVLRREREVQETAIEMLGEDLEKLSDEKDQLSQEREQLTKQLAEMRAQYTDLINENEQLHSEMSGVREKLSDSGMADDLLEQMEALRIKSEKLEAERDEAISEASLRRREVGELRSVIETYVEQIQDVQSFGVNEQVLALRTELDMVRRQAADDLEYMRSELNHTKSQMKMASERDVDEVAALQASRQEMVSLQHSLSEKDHMLRLSQGQCRSLEDAIEDRDKEVDQLKRKLELLLRKTGGLDLGSSVVTEYEESTSRISELGSADMIDENDPKLPHLGHLFRRK